MLEQIWGVSYYTPCDKRQRVIVEFAWWINLRTSNGSANNISHPSYISALRLTSFPPPLSRCYTITASSPSSSSLPVSFLLQVCLRAVAQSYILLLKKNSVKQNQVFGLISSLIHTVPNVFVNVSNKSFQCGIALHYNWHQTPGCYCHWLNTQMQNCRV